MKRRAVSLRKRIELILSFLNRDVFCRPHQLILVPNLTCIFSFKIAVFKAATSSLCF